MRLIKTEDDFLFMTYQQLKTKGGEYYPKVTSIPKGKRITPDIDLLAIDRYTKPPGIVGIEVKLVRKSDPFKYFYQGIGEVLCYYQHGVDRACLLLGLFNMPPNKADELEERLRKTYQFLQQWLLKLSYTSFMLFREDKGYISTLVEGKELFPVLSYEEARHKKECLLRGEFEWGKQWLKNREKAKDRTKEQ